MILGFENHNYTLHELVLVKLEVIKKDRNDRNGMIVWTLKNSQQLLMNMEKKIMEDRRGIINNN